MRLYGLAIRENTRRWCGNSKYFITPPCCWCFGPPMHSIVYLPKENNPNTVYVVSSPKTFKVSALKKDHLRVFFYLFFFCHINILLYLEEYLFCKTIHTHYVQFITAYVYADSQQLLRCFVRFIAREMHVINCVVK